MCARNAVLKVNSKVNDVEASLALRLKMKMLSEVILWWDIPEAIR
jgi:hypothetical protein